MPPGKKTKKTLACIFAGANVLGTWKRDNYPVLIYRYVPDRGKGTNAPLSGDCKGRDGLSIRRSGRED